MRMKMSKKIILGLASIVLLAGIGITVIHPGPAEAAISRITQVFVTNWPKVQKTAEQNLDTNRNIKVHEQGTANTQIMNWPSNQLVTVTNPLQILQPSKKIKTLGSVNPPVIWTDKIPIPFPGCVLYASYQGKGTMKYLTAVGGRGLGVEIWIDGEPIAAADGRDLEAYLGGLGKNPNENSAMGWRLVKMDEVSTSIEVNREYPFNNEIKIYLCHVQLPGDITGGAHIELETE